MAQNHFMRLKLTIVVHHPEVISEGSLQITRCYAALHHLVVWLTLLWKVLRSFRHLFCMLSR